MKKQNFSNNNKQKNVSIKTRKIIPQTLSDPMNPLQNTYLKEKRINMIINFLSQNDYPNNFSKKDFINMTIDFRPILKFIMEKLDPNCNLLESQTQDKIEALAKIYEYPGKLNKSIIRDFNTPSNFLYILTFICYMANLCSYKDYFINNEINNTFYKNENNIVSSGTQFLNEDEIVGDKREYYQFLDECINNNSETQKVDEVIEKYKDKISKLCKEELDIVEKNFAEYEQLEKENKQLESQLPNIDGIKSEENDINQKLNFTKEEYDKINEEINTFNQKLINIQENILQQESQLKNLNNEINNTRKIIDTQIMSRAEYDILKEENNNILNKIEMIKNDIDSLKNTKNDIINTNQLVINKLTILADDINKVDMSNNKTIKKMNINTNNNDEDENDNDISHLLNMSLVNKEIKNNILNEEIEKNKDLLFKYDQIIIKYKSYITNIKNDYNTNIINNNELSKNKGMIRSEIEKYNDLLNRDNQINNEHNGMMNKINMDISQFNKENNDYMNVLNNEIKIYENNIENKKQKLMEGENEYNKLITEFDEFKKETYELINALDERYNLYYNNFIDFSDQIMAKIVNCNQNLKSICDALPKVESKENEKK